MKISILGAGWFGCYIAYSLSNKGYDITIYEKKNDIFLNASGNNQNRLHLGYHYPRSKITTSLSKEGFKKFKKKFPFFSKKINKNYYAISNDIKTNINFKSYLKILKKLNLEYRILKKKKINFLEKIEGAVNTKEELILVEKAKKFFTKKLKDKIIYNYKVQNIKKRGDKYKINEKYYDVVIDCSSQQIINKFKIKNLLFEYCLLMIYKTNKLSHPAITIMDGPFFTLYPWDNKSFGLYSVRYSRVISNKNYTNLKKLVKNKVNAKYLNNIKKKIEKNFSYFYPDFKKNFKFIKFLKSYRTIIKNKNDDRDCKIFEKNKYIGIVSGKIDHIFFATREVERCLKKY